VHSAGSSNYVPLSIFLTCICLSRRLFRVTLKISQAECNTDVTQGTLTATDTCIGYHVRRFEISRKVILHTRYVSTRVRAGGGRGKGTQRGIFGKFSEIVQLRKSLYTSQWSLFWIKKFVSFSCVFDLKKNISPKTCGPHCVLFRTNRTNKLQFYVLFVVQQIICFDLPVCPNYACTPLPQLSRIIERTRYFKTTLYDLKFRRHNFLFCNFTVKVHAYSPTEPKKCSRCND
jgi:hypothetical protein